MQKDICYECFQFARNYVLHATIIIVVEKIS